MIQRKLREWPGVGVKAWEDNHHCETRPHILIAVVGMIEVRLDLVVVPVAIGRLRIATYMSSTSCYSSQCAHC